MTTKADYVRSQGQTRNHHCHWPGCDKQVPPAMWGCKGHWFTLPAVLRARVWATYKPGQEVNGTPSAAYIEVAKAVQAWISERDRHQQPAARACGHPLGSTRWCPDCELAERA